MNKLLIVSNFSCIALALSGCSTLYKLDVTAYNNPNIDVGKSYVILSGNPNVDVNSAEFAQYAAQVERALEPKGYHRVSEDDLSDAALGIYVSMGVSDPAKRYHSVTTGLYETPYADESAASVRNSGSSASENPGATAPKMPTTPAPEILSGIEETGFATTVYTKQLNLVAIDLQNYIKDIARVGREEAVPVEVWSVDIETTGQPRDMNEVFPVMVAAGQPYLGDTTEDVVHLKISGTDKRVNEIRSAQ